ncbi:MAG TPA: tetratricopeptide repeat protein [Chthoniobacterales bacterium]
MRFKLPAAATPRSLTLTLSLWLLGALAVVQIFALTWKVIPPIGGRTLAGAMAGKPPEAPYRPEAVAPAAPLPSLPAPPIQQQSLGTQRAQALMAESQKLQNIGQWDQALPFIEQALQILPDDPQILYQYAAVLGRLQRETEALDVLDQLLALRTLDPAKRKEVQKLASFLEQTQYNVQTINPPALAEDGPVNLDIHQKQAGGPLLEDVGLQPGATMGIVDVKEIDAGAGKKGLRIAIKTRPNTKVAAPSVNVLVKFFEKNANGDVVLTSSQAKYEWISQPIDWKDDLPEILDVIYPLPGSRDASPEDAGNAYYGYVVGVYFNGGLEDNRANPGNLQFEFPFELFLTNK